MSKHYVSFIKNHYGLDNGQLSKYLQDKEWLQDHQSAYCAFCSTETVIFEYTTQLACSFYGVLRQLRSIRR